MPVFVPVPAPPRIQDDVNENGETQHEQCDHIGLFLPELLDSAGNRKQIHGDVWVKDLFRFALLVWRFPFGSGIEGQLQE